MGISIVAIVIAGISIIITTNSLTDSIDDFDELEDKYVPQTREIYLFTQVDEAIDEEKYVIPPDMFSQDTIVVKKGDNVKIHFYNLEPAEKQEHHTFTITDPAYNIHGDINSEENMLLEFTASESGIFEYICTYHQPTMKGELVVLP